MSDNERQNIINLFKNNVKGYLAINDIQEIITCITYLFWNSKYVVKEKFNDSVNPNEYLQKGTKENQDVIYNICNCIRPTMVESNLYNICKFLDEMSEEKLINIISDDFGIYSRYNIGTPNSINELCYKILEHNNSGNDVLDICSFTGNFLTYYAKKQPSYYYSGIEISTRSNLVAQLRLNILNVKNELFNNNVFDYNTNKKYDKIFCNYPLGVKLDDHAVNYLNNINNRINYIYTNKTSSSWAFINIVINSLKDTGKAIVVMNNAGLYSLKNSDVEFRKLLVSGGYIESVISLPEKLFANTSIPVTLLVLSNNNDKIKFINAEKMIQNNKLINSAKLLNIEEILNEYANISDSSYTKIIDNKELVNESFNLHVQNYMGIENLEIKFPRILNELCFDVYRGYQISANDINLNSEPQEGLLEHKIVNIVNIIDGIIENNLTKIYLEDGKLNKYLLKNKDLLVTLKGAITRFSVVELKENERLIPSGNFTVLRLDTSIVNPYYLKMFFESSKGNAIINSIKSGGALPSINISQLKDIKVPVPPIEEQNKIVNRYLAKTDEIQMIKSKLKNLENSLTEIKNEEF
ncbi:MAG: N-6 DNA methylase [Bacilli bacterium]|nr:N-6 DNA methylase [Bacilli bacterium]